MRSRDVAILFMFVLLGTLVVSVTAEGPAPRTVVLNEVELNPNGLDRDAEWVEILNIGAEAVDLAGWTVSYNYPTDGTAVLAEGSSLLRPGQRMVFRYEGLRLRNDANTVIRLRDAAGTLVDETSALRDVYDDAKTWQRIPDGGDPLLPIWLLREGTKNAPNK